MHAKGAEVVHNCPGTTEGQVGVLGQETLGTNSGKPGEGGWGGGCVCVENHNRKAKIGLNGE